MTKTHTAHPLNSILSAPVADGIVALVLVQHEDLLVVQSISSFAEAAHHPASLWVAVPKASNAYPLMRDTEQFALAVLSYKQWPIARRFASITGVGVDRMNHLQTYKSQQGFNFLHGALASTGCRIRATLDLDDSVLFVADIVESCMDSRRATERQLLLSELWRA